MRSTSGPPPVPGRCTAAAADRPKVAPGRSRRSLTSFQSPARIRQPSTSVAAIPAADLGVRERQPGRDVVGDGHRRERVGLLEDHADLLADVGHRWPGA